MRRFIVILHIAVVIRLWGLERGRVRAYVWLCLVFVHMFDGCVRRLVCDVRAFGVRAFGVWCSMFVRSTFVMFDVRCSMFDVWCAYMYEEC